MTPTGLTFYLAIEPIDMRRSFDGLAALALSRLGRDIRAERAMIVFVNRRRDTLKLLWCDATGVCILGKRLEKREVSLPSSIPAGAHSIIVDARALAALLDGVVQQKADCTSTHRSTVTEARAAGCRTVDGLGMLIHQAALQQLAWLGRHPDVAVMRQAAHTALSERSAATAGG